jgi:hypothetical protein
MACCIDILSSGYAKVGMRPGVATRTYRQHSRLPREWTRKECTLFIDFRELVEGY